MNPGALMAPMFLPDPLAPRSPENRRPAVSSCTLRFGAVTNSFQPLVGISGRSAGAPPTQARVMCIKCARTFHKEDRAYRCNATFIGKAMYKRCDRCAEIKTSCIAVSIFVGYAS